MDIDNLTPLALAGIIDHTFLKPFGTPQDIQTLCEEALQYHFAMVAVNPAEVANCVRLLAGSKVRTGAAIGFPLGQTTSEVKAFEIRDAIQKGAGEIDMVINLRALQSGEIARVRQEFADMVKTCRPAGVINKVILETCYLTDPQKRLVCQIALEEGVDFVKTSTGFGPDGATVADVQLMRAVAGQAMGVKAAGKMRDLATTLAMLAAGANRIGTTAGVSIIEELKARQAQ